MHDVTNMTIHIAAAAIIRDGSILLVRKKGSEYYIQPGGKIEPNEQPAQALIRELAEELHFTISENDLIYLGQFSDIAVHENVPLLCDLFRINTNQVKFYPNAEIEEVVWCHAETNLKLAPLSARHIIPFLQAP